MTERSEQPPNMPGLIARLGQGVTALAIWTLSRILVYRLWTASETFIDFDVRYYHWQLIHFGVQGALIEYPPTIAVLLEAIRRTIGHDEQSFVTSFAAVMLLLDLITAVWLWSRYSRTAAVYWASFTAVIGALVWYRIDLLPAVAVVVSLVWLVKRPLGSGAAIALGAATKLWPAMLIFPMLGRDRAAQRRVLSFGAVGGLLGLGSLILFGWDRSVSPLHWQSDRGLQIESIAASWPMWRRTFRETAQYQVELSQYNAWQISGPQVAGWLQLTDWLMVCCVLLALVLGWLIGLGGLGLPGHTLPRELGIRQHAQRTHALVLAQLAIICSVIVANKTFSPQYMIWLAGPLAVLVALPLPRRDQIAAIGLAIGGLVVGALTHLVFPLNYGGLIGAQPESGVTRLLVTRNVVMVLLTVGCVVLAIRASLRWQRTSPQQLPASSP